MSPESAQAPWEADVEHLLRLLDAQGPGGRLQPAVAPNGEPHDHDCSFRRMIRDIAALFEVPQHADGNYDGTTLADRLELAARLWREHVGS